MLSTLYYTWNTSKNGKMSTLTSGLNESIHESQSLYCMPRFFFFFNVLFLSSLLIYKRISYTFNRPNVWMVKWIQVEQNETWSKTTQNFTIKVTGTKKKEKEKKSISEERTVEKKKRKWHFCVDIFYNKIIIYTTYHNNVMYTLTHN